MNVGELIDHLKTLPKESQMHGIKVSDIFDNCLIKVPEVKKFNVQKSLEFLLKNEHVNKTMHDNEIGDFEFFINLLDLYEN